MEGGPVGSIVREMRCGNQEIVAAMNSLNCETCCDQVKFSDSKLGGHGGPPSNNQFTLEGAAPSAPFQDICPRHGPVC
jgi:hypothetical protein